MRDSANDVVGISSDASSVRRSVSRRASLSAAAVQRPTDVTSLLRCPYVSYKLMRHNNFRAHSERPYHSKSSAASLATSTLAHRV